jgi:hypothetical protein
MGGRERYGGMMLVTDGRTGEISSGMMQRGDGRKGVNRIGLIIVIPNTAPLE